MKKILFLILFSLLLPHNSFAKQDKEENRPQISQNKKERNKKENRENKLFYDYQYLSNEERIVLISRLLEEHKNLTTEYTDITRTNEIRNEIIWLLPNRLEEDVVKTAYNTKEIFEEAVHNAVQKMEKTPGLRYTIKDKKMFGIKVDYIK